MSDELTAIEVTVSRIIDDDGRMKVKVITPPTYSMVEVLGLLETAKFYIYSEMRKRDD